jgi:predicted methyltransferase
MGRASCCNINCIAHLQNQDLQLLYLIETLAIRVHKDLKDRQKTLHDFYCDDESSDIDDELLDKDEKIPELEGVDTVKIAEGELKKRIPKYSSSNFNDLTPEEQKEIRRKTCGAGFIYG